MPHDHGHGMHDHAHGEHDHTHPEPLDPALDVSVDDADLSPHQLGRRTFLRSAGLLGAGATATVLGTGPAEEAAAARKRPRRGGYLWLAGDHYTNPMWVLPGRS